MKHIVRGMAGVLALLLHSCAADSPGAATVTVGGTGADYQTIGHALEAAPDDVTVFVLADGEFIEPGLIISRPATIRGRGADRTFLLAATSPGEAADRVLTVAEKTEVSLENLCVGNGVATDTFRRGGGILNLGILTMESCAVRDNRAVYGVGLDNRGTARIRRTDFSGNRSLPMNREERMTGLGCTGSGGAVKNEPGATLLMDRCVLRDNRASARGGGLFIACESEADLERCVISGNTADRGGGGIHIRGELVLRNCRITGNRSREGGGGLGVEGRLDFTGNRLRDNFRNDVMITDTGSGIHGRGIIGENRGNRIGTLVEDA